MINPSSPITGSAITGLTSPTYTLTADNPPDSNSKAYVVTSLGGTQTGVVAHSNMMPMRVVAKRPARVKIPGQRSMTTGMYLTGGKNEYSYTFVKGANITGSSSNPQYDNIVASSQSLSLLPSETMSRNWMRCSALWEVLSRTPYKVFETPLETVCSDIPSLLPIPNFRGSLWNTLEKIAPQGQHRLSQ
jgi:hypothetical protein